MIIIYLLIDDERLNWLTSWDQNWYICEGRKCCLWVSSSPDLGLDVVRSKGPWTSSLRLWGLEFYSSFCYLSFIRQMVLLTFVGATCWVQLFTFINGRLVVLSRQVAKWVNIVWRRKVAPWRYLGSYCVKHYCLVQILLFEWIVVTRGVLSVSTTFCVTALHNVLAATLRTAYCVRVSRPW